MYWLNRYGLTLFVISSVSISTATAADDTICSASGLAGFAFGAPLDENKYTLVETANSGVASFRAETGSSDPRYATAIVSVTPFSRKIMAVDYRQTGEKKILRARMDAMKKAFEEANATVKWDHLGNQYDARNLDGFDLSIAVKGDPQGDGSNHRLSYHCVHAATAELALTETLKYQLQKK